MAEEETSRARPRLIHGRLRSWLMGPLRWLTVVLAGVVAVNALVGGALLIAAPDGRLLGLPRALLAGTPFADYAVPGLTLLLAVGGTTTIAAVARLRRAPRSAWLTLLAGLTLVVWMGVQLLLIGTVHPLQPVLVSAGAALVLLGVLELLSTGAGTRLASGPRQPNGATR